MQSVLQNLRFTVRMLWKSPGLTVTILLTLALGIGANTAMFTVDYATLLAPLPYPHPDRLVVVWSKVQNVRGSVSGADFRDGKEQASSFEALSAVAPANFNIASRDKPESIHAWRVTVGWWRMFGV